MSTPPENESVEHSPNSVAAPTSHSTFRWVVGSIAVVAALSAIVATTNTKPRGESQAQPSVASSAVVEDTEPSPEPSPEVEPEVEPEVDVEAEPETAPEVDTDDESDTGSALAARGITDDDVRALGFMADEYGYGLGPGTSLPFDQAQSFAYVVLLSCDELAAGTTTQSALVDDDVMSGAAPSDASAFWSYATGRFCP